MIKIISNGHDKNSPAWINKPSTIDDLKEVLTKYTLDPTFERYGNFINHRPQWKKDCAEKYKNCSVVFGNFLTLSHVFNIITDDKKLLKELGILIESNKSSKEYIEAKEQLIANKKYSHAEAY